MATTFDGMLEEGLFDTMKDLGKRALQSTGKALSATGQDTRDRFQAMIGDQQAAGRLDTNAVLADLMKAFQYYCGQQGLKPTAMAVVEFLSTVRGEQELANDDSWVKWLSGTPNIKLPAPNSKVINSQFNILVKKADDPIATSKAVAKIAQLSQGNHEDYMLINNWMRMISITKPDILGIPALSPILHLLDRDLDPKELNTFFTIVARDMLRTKAIQDMAKGATKVGAQGSPEGNTSVDKNPKTKRTNFNVPIGKPTTPSPKLSVSDLMTDIHKLSRPLYTFLVSGQQQPFNESQATALLGSLLQQSREAELFSAMSARILAILTYRMSSNAVASLYYKYTRSKVTGPDGKQDFVSQIIPQANIVALCDWIKLGGTLDEVTAEFNATINKFGNAALTTVFLAGMLKPEDTKW